MPKMAKMESNFEEEKNLDCLIRINADQTSLFNLPTKFGTLADLSDLSLSKNAASFDVSVSDFSRTSCMQNQQFT